MQEKNPLGEEKIHKLIFKFSLPAIVGMTVNSLYNFVDRLFIGNAPDLGPNGLAAMTIVLPIVILLIAVGVLFGLGGATLFSIRLGENKPDQAEKVLGNTLFMLVTSGIIFTVVLQIFLEPTLSLFGASEEVLPFAKEYMQILLFGSFFQIGGMGLNHFIRADGHPRFAMFTMFIGAGLNIILDPIFIFGLNMGMRGAALATVISQGLSFVWVVYYFIGKSSKNKLRAVNLIPDFHYIIKIISLGAPDSALQIATSILNVILNRGLYTYGGDMAVSAMGITHSLVMLLLLPVIGLRQGIQPIISFNYGAKKFDRVISATKQGIFVATVMVMISYIITRLFPGPLVAMFNRDPDLITFGVMSVRAWLMMMPVIGFQIVGSSFFQAIGRYKSALFLTMTRQVILLIPALLVFPRIWGLQGLLHAAPFADFFSFILTAIWLYFGIKNLRNEHQFNMENDIKLSECVEKSKIVI